MMEVVRIEGENFTLEAFRAIRILLPSFYNFHRVQCESISLYTYAIVSS